MSDSRGLTVAVPTFHRPRELARLLHALAQLPGTVEEAAVEVLIIDNDPDGSARAGVIDRLPSARYVVESHPGLAAVRNRALDECADRRWLVFIDDDEVPTPGWLPALLSCARKHSAAAVLGRVISEPEAELDDWLIAYGAFQRPARRTGDLLRAAATNNLLLDLDAIRHHGIRFDPRLGMSGGEDSLFTSRLRMAGERLVWCDDAVVIDHVPAERVSRSWVLERAFRGGSVMIEVERLLDRGRGARLGTSLRGAVRGGARIVAGAAMIAGGAATRSLPLRARGSRRMWRGFGALAGSFGYVHQEYARRHRDTDRPL